MADDAPSASHSALRSLTNWIGLAILVVSYAVALSHMHNVKAEQYAAVTLTKAKKELEVA